MNVRIVNATMQIKFLYTNALLSYDSRMKSSQRDNEIVRQPLSYRTLLGEEESAIEQRATGNEYNNNLISNPCRVPDTAHPYINSGTVGCYNLDRDHSHIHSGAVGCDNPDKDHPDTYACAESDNLGYMVPNPSTVLNRYIHVGAVGHENHRAMAQRPISLMSEYQTCMIPNPSTVLDKISPDLRAEVEPCLLDDSSNILQTGDTCGEGKIMLDQDWVG